MPVEQAREVFYSFPIEEGLPLQLSWYAAFREFTVVVIGERLKQRFLGWGVSLLKGKSEGKGAMPAAGSIIRSPTLLLVRGEITTVVEIVSHVLPEVVVDSLFFLPDIKSGFSLCCKRWRHGYALCVSRRFPFFVAQR